MDFDGGLLLLLLPLLFMEDEADVIAISAIVALRGIMSVDAVGHVCEGDAMTCATSSTIGKGIVIESILVSDVFKFLNCSNNSSVNCEPVSK